MKIIIIGNGKVGSDLSAQLSLEGHDVTAIDKNANALAASAEQNDIMTLVGNGESMEILKEADAAHADLLIAATDLDESNILACLTGRKLGAKHTIARVRTPEYTHQLHMMMEELGLSMVVNPELDAAREAFRLLQFPSLLKRETFAKGRMEIVGIKVDEKNGLSGTSLEDLYSRVKARVMVCAVDRNGEVHIPTGTFVIENGDTIYVTAELHELSKLIKHLGLAKKRIKSLFIIGGSRISYYLARRCTENGMSVKIIEQNHARCVRLAEMLPKATIIEGDGSKDDVLIKEGLPNYDACITLTGIDEENLVLSLYASELGAGKIITKIDRTNFSNIFKKIGIGSTISPKELCTANIVRYVRAMSTAEGRDSVLSLHPIVHGEAEAMEFLVDENVRYQGTKLSDIPIKKGIILTCITRRGKNTLPKGDDFYEDGDSVIVVTSGGKMIKEMNDIFSE